MTTPYQPPADAPPRSSISGADLALLDRVYQARSSRVSLRSTPVGNYVPEISAFPTVAVSAGNAATGLSGSPETIYVGTIPASFQGNWATGTAYTTGQSVNVAGDPGSMLWTALKNNTGVTPGTDPTTWQAATLDPRISYIGDPAVFWQVIDSGQSIWQNGAQNAFVNANVARNITPAFQYAGEDMEILLPGFTGMEILLTIDGVVDPAGWRTIGTDSETHRVRLTWDGGVDTHTVACQIAAGFFHGVTIGASDNVQPVDKTPAPLMIVQGDSIGQGQNTDGTKMQTYPYYLAQIMGWDGGSDSEGGTGTLNPGTLGGFTTTINRIPRCAAINPQVLINATGLNDQSTDDYTSSQLTVATSTWINNAKAALPAALLIGVGPFFTTDQATDPTDYATIAAARDAQLIAWQVAGATTEVAPGVWAGPGLIYVDTDGWLTGRKTVGGLANVMLSGDGIHPLMIGHRYYAKRIAAGILAALPVAGFVI